MKIITVGECQSSSTVIKVSLILPEPVNRFTNALTMYNCSRPIKQCHDAY